MPTGYIKTTGSNKKIYYVQKDAKFNQAYAGYGISSRVVEGKTTTYMAAAPSGYTKVIDANGVKALANLPSREVLVAKLLGSMNAPIANCVGVLSAVIRNFVGVVDAIREKKEKEAAA